MMVGNKCTTCHDRIDSEDLMICDTCGRELHKQCEEYETAFECRRCGDETWIGTIEF